MFKAPPGPAKITYSSIPFPAALPSRLHISASTRVLLSSGTRLSQAELLSHVGAGLILCRLPVCPKKIPQSQNPSDVVGLSFGHLKMPKVVKISRVRFAFSNLQPGICLLVRQVGATSWWFFAMARHRSISRQGGCWMLS